jgi:hypothetical protein
MAEGEPSNSSDPGAGPADWIKYGGRVARWFVLIGSIILALDYVVRAGDSLLSNMAHLCESHPAVCFWTARDCPPSLPLEDYLKCNP